uniref:Insulin-like 2 n=1 Tax=Ciona intestinalis TaxID=7719 RepID=Q0GRC2_CIOIN|nr:insulin-like 2 precursor [Ciona intestinalis]
MKIVIVVLIVLFIITPSPVESWSGACGARLINRLRFICGERGVFNPKTLLLRMKYPGRYRHHRRTRSATTIKEIIQETSPSVSVLRGLVTVGNHLHNNRRRLARRVRRDLVTECCRGSCNRKWILRTYCG